MVDRFRPGDGGRPKVRGFSPVGAGLQLSVLGVSFAITAPLSGRLVGRVGPRWPMLAGLVAAMWVSGTALFGAAALAAVLLRPAIVRAHRPTE